MDGETKLIEVMRVLGLFNALIDEDETHWLIITNIGQFDQPARVSKKFTEWADVTRICGVLRCTLDVECTGEKSCWALLHQTSVDS